MSPEARRKSQPIFSPTESTELVIDQLKTGNGSDGEKLDRLTKAVVLVLKAVDIQTQQQQWRNDQLDDISDKVDSITNKMEEYVAIRLMKFFITLSASVLGGIVLAFFLKLIFGK